MGGSSYSNIYTCPRFSGGSLSFAIASSGKQKSKLIEEKTTYKDHPLSLRCIPLWWALPRIFVWDDGFYRIKLVDVHKYVRLKERETRERSIHKGWVAIVSSLTNAWGAGGKLYDLAYLTVGVFVCSFYFFPAEVCRR